MPSPLSTSQLPSLGKRRLVATFSPPKPRKLMNRKSRALDFGCSDSGSGHSSGPNALAKLSSESTSAETESSGSSSRRQHIILGHGNISAASLMDTRVLIPQARPSPSARPRSSTTPRRLHQSLHYNHVDNNASIIATSPLSTTTPIPLYRPLQLHQGRREVPQGPSVCDPICFGFFSRHKAPTTRPPFPKCLAVVLRDPSEQEWNSGQSQWRQERMDALEQDELFQTDSAIESGSVVVSSSTADISGNIRLSSYTISLVDPFPQWQAWELKTP